MAWVVISLGGKKGQTSVYLKWYLVHSNKLYVLLECDSSSFDISAFMWVI